MKGQLFTLEAAIAILMILIIIVFLFSNPPESPEFNKINYKLKIYNGLKILDETGRLSTYVSNNDANAIQNGLKPYVSNIQNYKVVIFNQSTNITQKPSLFNESEVISVSYFLAGDIDNYQPRDVRVYLWGLS